MKKNKSKPIIIREFPQGITPLFGRVGWVVSTAEYPHEPQYFADLVHKGMVNDDMAGIMFIAFANHCNRKTCLKKYNAKHNDKYICEDPGGGHWHIERLQWTKPDDAILCRIWRQVEWEYAENMRDRIETAHRIENTRRMILGLPELELERFDVKDLPPGAPAPVFNKHWEDLQDLIDDVCEDFGLLPGPENQDTESTG